MRRVWQIAIAVAVVGLFSGERFCAEEHALALPSDPAGWKLTAPQTCVKPVPADWRVWRGTAGAARACRAEYTGSPPMSLTIYDMPNEFASAFDAAQKWQPQPGKMAFFKGRYFGTVESPAADRFALERFVLAVESTLPAGNEWHH
jgi:hypothetical protein